MFQGSKRTYFGPECIIFGSVTFSENNVLQSFVGKLSLLLSCVHQDLQIFTAKLSTYMPKILNRVLHLLLFDGGKLSFLIDEAYVFHQHTSIPNRLIHTHPAS